MSRKPWLKKKSWWIVRRVAEHRFSPITEMHFGGMELHLLGTFNISILVVLGKVKSWVWKHDSVTSAELFAVWLLDHLHLKHWHPTGHWNNFTLQRNVTLQGEWWENVLLIRWENVLWLFIHRPEGTQMRIRTLTRHISGFSKPLELKGALSLHNPRMLFFLCKFALAVQEGGKFVLFSCWTVVPLVDQLTNNQL